MFLLVASQGMMRAPRWSRTRIFRMRGAVRRHERQSRLRLIQPDRWEIVKDLELCVDCVIGISNGVDDDATEQAMTRMAEMWHLPWEVHTDCPPENCDGWFSWQSCDGCGSTLGGVRHPGLAMRRRTV